MKLLSIYKKINNGLFLFLLFLNFLLVSLEFSIQEPNNYFLYIFTFLKIIFFLLDNHIKKSLALIFLISEALVNLYLFNNLEVVNFLIFSVVSLFLLIINSLSDQLKKTYKVEFIYLIIFFNTFLVFVIEQFSTDFYLFKARWAFKEFIISYFGSFHRRGAIGSLLNTFSDSFNELVINAFTFTIFLEILVLVTLFQLIKSFNLRNKFLILLLPFSMNFHLKVEEFGRKDSLFLILFIVFLLLVKDKEKLDNFKIVVIFFAFGIFVILSHEAVVFFLPFYFLVNWRLKIHHQSNVRVDKVDYILGLFTLIGVAMLVFFRQLGISVSDYENNLLKKYPNETSNCCMPPVQYLKYNFSEYLVEVRSNLNLEYINNWFYLIFLILLLSFFISKTYNYQTNAWFLFFFTTPLYFAQDWGRWLFLYFMHFILTESYLSNERKSEIKISNKLFLVLLLTIVFTIPTGPQQELDGFVLEIFNTKDFYKEYFVGNYEYSINQNID